MPPEPPADRSLSSLAPLFRVPFLAWLEHVSSQVTHVEFIVTETRRSLDRQRWLYAQGREDPFRNRPERTWTLDSRHRWGLAADLAMMRKETGELIWEVSSWAWLYRVYPLEPYGLRSLAPREWVHVELYFADAAIRDASALGLWQA